MSSLLKTIYLIVLGVVLISLIGCSDPVEYTDEEPSIESYATGLLRFIHSASTTEYMYIDYRDLDTGSLESFLNNTKYGNQYGYYNFRTGEREFIAYESYTSFEISKVSFVLEEDHKYSVIAYDYEATLNPGLMVIQDTLASADSTYSLVRFLHLGSDLSSITISESDSSEIITELDHLEHSTYINMPARTHIFDVKLKASNETVLTGIHETFLPGVTYTVILSGSLNGMTPVGLNLNFLRDASIKYSNVD